MPEPEAPSPIPDRLDEFAAAYPIPVTRMRRVVAIWQMMTANERSNAINGAKQYCEFIAKNPKRSVRDAHRWLGDQGWRGFVKPGKEASASASSKVFVAENSDAFRAWIVYRKLIGLRPVPTSEGPSGRGWWFPSEWPPLGRGLPTSERDWIFVPHGSPEWWAWQERLRAYAGPGRENSSPSLDVTSGGPASLGRKFPSRWPPAE